MEEVVTTVIGATHADFTFMYGARCLLSRLCFAAAKQHGQGHLLLG